MIIPNIWENKKCSKPPTRYTHTCHTSQEQVLQVFNWRSGWSNHHSGKQHSIISLQPIIPSPPLEPMIGCTHTHKQTHKRSELSYRIVKWSASDVQKNRTRQTNTTKMSLSMCTDIYVYIYTHMFVITEDVASRKRQQYTIGPLQLWFLCARRRRHNI